MPRDQVHTMIADRDGVEHDYVTIPFAFDNAINLKLKILKIIVRPLVEGIQEFAGFAKLARAGEMTDGELDAMSDARFGEIVDQIPERLILAGGADLLAEILKDTVRTTPGAGPDGQKLVLRLGKPAARDQAYSGGNWLEAYRAVAWVLAVNYAPFGTGGSGSLSDIWSALRDLLPRAMTEQSIPSTAPMSDDSATSERG